MKGLQKPIQSVQSMRKSLSNLSHNKGKQLQSLCKRTIQKKPMQQVMVISPEEGEPGAPSIRISGRERKKPEKFADMDFDAKRKKTAKLARIINPNTEPQSLQEAIEHPLYGKQWEQAINDEYDALVKNDTWILVEELPAGRKAVSCK